MAFLLLGRSVWPGVAVAAFVVNFPISTGGLAASATAAGNTLAPLVAATLLAKVGFRRQIDRLRDAAAIVFVGALLSMSISASIGAGVLVASGALRADDVVGAWAVWWAGDAMGVVVVTPFVLSLLLPWRRETSAPWKPLEAAMLFALIATVSPVAIGTDPHLMFLVIPLLGWAAWRFQQRGAAPAALLVVVVASWAAAKGVGPFRAGTLLEKMLTLQAFNATVAFCSTRCPGATPAYPRISPDPDDLSNFVRLSRRRRRYPARPGGPGWSSDATGPGLTALGAPVTLTWWS